MRTKEKLLYGLIAVALMAIAGFTGVFLAGRKSSDISRITDTASSSEGTIDETNVDTTDYSIDSFDGSITYQGKKYEPNTRIDTVLFLGIDNSDQSREGIGIDEGGRSDTIVLFALDNENKTITPLEISRDTIVDVDVYDNDGNYLTSGPRQITMQYSYGASTKEACNLSKEKISDLLCRTRIDGVISLTMDGIEPIVDSIGGVTLQLLTDETDLDPSYTEGSIIHLDGKAARDFVHTRDVTTRGSNNGRMSRQTQFMMALFNTVRGKGGSVVDTMEEAAGDYLYEDIDADTMKAFTEYSYSGDVKLLPGENVEGQLHDEFYVDENKLTELVLELFYKQS